MPRHLRPAFITPTLHALLLRAFVAATLVAAFQTSVTHADEKPMERTITVSATGTVEAEPDQARITSGVTTEATSAREALTGNSEAMTKVISELKAKGIDAKDIQTASFNVEPVIDYSKDGQPPKTRGYRVSNQVVILVRDLGQLGAVLDNVIRRRQSDAGIVVRGFQSRNAERRSAQGGRRQRAAPRQAARRRGRSRSRAGVCRYPKR